MKSLKIENLTVEVEGKKVLDNFSLEIKAGEIHSIMGPNGSGKSSLANTLMGHPKYHIVKGKIFVDGKEITKSSVDERAKAGLFLSMQHPPEINGITVSNFLRAASDVLQGEKTNPIKFYKDLVDKAKAMDINPEFLKRYLNLGFSGGEKKQMEILQLLTIDPKYAILDEIDSGLDVDALRRVAKGINKFYKKDKAVFLITHYNRILRYVKPDFVHIMQAGKIIASGDKKLAQEIERKGYEKFKNLKN